MMTTTDSGMAAVNQLLRDTADVVSEISEVKPRPVRAITPKEMDTGVYSTQFFLGADVPPVSALEHLSDSRVGLSLFLEEASKALALPTDELTPDQRIHISTIVSYIDALADRLDRVRVPNFVQKRRGR